MLKLSLFLGFFGLSALSALSSAAMGADDQPWQHERKILGVKHLEAIEAVAGTPVYDLGAAIARMEKVDPGTDFGIGYCTAFHIGPHLFMTNQHCVLPCDQMNIRLGYEKALSEGQQQIYRCTSVVYSNQALDYALIAADPALQGDAAKEIAFPTLTVYAGPIHDGDAVYAISHASGGYKEIDRSSACALGSVTVFHTDTGRDTIKHRCDTLTGSSGAPLLDRDHGYVVGLHWAGIPDQYNMAIPMSLIIADMQANLTPAVLGQIAVAP